MDVENLSSLEYHISQLRNFVQSMAVGNIHVTRICVICEHPEHPTNMCPFLEKDDYYPFNANGGFLSHQQKNFDPYSNTYNLGWNEHPNFSYGISQSNFEEYYPLTAATIC